MIILAIETSCDETAVAIVKFEKNKVEVLSNIVSSQIRTHSKFGGVVPSLAARMHLKNMVPVLKRALKKAKINKNKIDYISVTNGPGLIPPLIIGVGAAKALAYSLDKPLVGVNHLEGHVYANWLTKLKVRKVESFELWQPEFPILCLTVSGGHTQLILMKKDLNYKIIGETMDDAAGEAFDKVAKLLGVGYPGGPMIEKMAKRGDKNKFNFPRPMMNSDNFNFSFSGLKTAVLYKLKLETGNWEIGKLENKKGRMKFQSSDADLNPAKLQTFPSPSLSGGGQNISSPKLPITDYQLQYKQDIAASFQEAVIDVLVSKTVKAAKKYKVKNIILGGGVSANKELQRQLKEKINKGLTDVDFRFPVSDLSTDNALMIAVAAYYNIINNKNIKSWKNVKADANLKLK